VPDEKAIGVEVLRRGRRGERRGGGIKNEHQKMDIGDAIPDLQESVILKPM
jgi:hypothetical protein